MSKIQNKILRLVGARYETNRITIQEGGHITSDELTSFYERSIQNAFGRTGLALDFIDYKLSRRRSVGRDVDSDTLRLSLVSSALDIRSDGSGHLGLQQFEDARYILLPTKNYNRENWIANREVELQSALVTDPDIVCFPEFAYPPPAEKRTYRDTNHGSPVSRNKTIANDYIDRSSYGRHRAEYEGRIKSTLRHKGEPFVFLGSYHCAFDFYNVGVVFPLGAHDGKFQADVVSKQMDKYGKAEVDKYDISPPVLYRKRFPARRMLEYVRIPSNFEFHTYDVDGVNIATIICSDALDLNQFFNLVRVNTGDAGRKKIDVILVPAFNLSDKLLSMCRELSFLTGAFVVYVNANDKECETALQEEPSIDGKPAADVRTEIFVCGFSSKDLERLSGDAHNIIRVDSKVTLPNGSIVYHYTIDLKRRRYLFDRIMKLRDDELTRGSTRTTQIYP